MSAPFLVRFGPLSRAEVTMVEGIGSGMSDRVGSGGLPQEGDEDRRVRAALIRALLLGGPDVPAMHEKGLRLSGAWITGPLDLEGCRVPLDIGLQDCRFDAAPVLRSAVIDTVSFDGSYLPGLPADRLEARGDILLRSATVTGPISLRGARIGSDLVMDGMTLSHEGDRALSAERIFIRGSALMRGATVRGGIALLGARIGGDFDLVGSSIERPSAPAVEADSADITGDAAFRQARITGMVSLVTARIGGDVDLTGTHAANPGDVAVRLNRTVVGGALFLRDGAAIDGALSLNGAELGAITDEAASWPKPGDLLLNRCLYKAFLGAPVGAADRLNWLSRQDPSRWGEDFWPQPYEHLARVLAEMGHDDDAMVVLLEKDRLWRRAARLRAPSLALRLAMTLRDAILGMTIGYGRRPLRALIWLLVLGLMGWAVYVVLEREGAIRPNVSVILRSPEWVLCGVPEGEKLFLVSLGTVRSGLAKPGQTQLRCFHDQPESAAYPKHNALMLSVDTLIPVMETGQRDFWSPDTRTPLGRAGKSFLYFQTLAGWALSLLAVAGFSGIVKPK
ncbi:MAG: hypothetical protein ACK5UA_03195 [Cereibacter sp.]